MRSIFFIILLLVSFSGNAFGQELTGLFPVLNSKDVDGGAVEYSLSLQVLILMAVLTVLPSVLLGMTAFTRIIIVLSILRQALGTQQTPPNQVLIALSLFLTFYIMSPILDRAWLSAGQPYVNGEMEMQTAIETGGSIFKAFMIANTREADLIAFSGLANMGGFEDNADIPYRILLPAFITSELKVAFQIGFLIFLPFLVIDLLISSILMSLGMMMLSAMLVGLAFKLLLFVLVGGWTMGVGSLGASYTIE